MATEKKIAYHLQMKTLQVYPVVYVLLLEGDAKHPNYYYIGDTLNFNQRMSQHWQGIGARWTRLHKPISVIRVELVQEGDADILENCLTLEYMALHGSDVVRGGKYYSP